MAKHRDKCFAHAFILKARGGYYIWCSNTGKVVKADRHSDNCPVCGKTIIVQTEEMAPLTETRMRIYSGEMERWLDVGLEKSDHKSCCMIGGQLFTIEEV